MDLGLVQISGSYGDYFLRLSLKNTGDVPITRLFVTLDSVQINMTFTYLNVTISGDAPLPPYQTASGRQVAYPPINQIGTYPLIVQATATNAQPTPTRQQ